MKKTLLFMISAAFVFTGCSSISNRVGANIGRIYENATIIGVRGNYLKFKDSDDSYGGDVFLVGKGQSNSAVDISYGVYVMNFDGHKTVSDGTAKASVFSLTYRYYLGSGAPTGLYLGAGWGQYRFSYKIDPEAQAAIEADDTITYPCDLYRERFYDSDAFHYELGLDIPLGTTGDLGFGVRMIDLQTRIKKLFDANVVKEKADIDPTVWYVTFSFLF